MSDRSTKRESGFSLLEMVVAMSLGTLVLGAAVQIYSQGVAATWTVTQRAEMQQDFRAASNMLTRDLNLAGAGLTPPGAAIQLPTSATLPVYGCSEATGTPCYLGTTNAVAATYPVQGTTPYLYGLLPGYDGGPTLIGMQTDVVTVVYTDPLFFLDCYQATVSSSTTVTFALTVASQASANCTANGATIQAINDSAVGLTPGDLVLFTFGTTSVVAEIYGSATTATVATFGTGDVLKMNQAAAAAKSLASITTGTVGTGTRIQVITYYIDKTVTPSRLMRQLSGHPPMPVAENVVYMKFTYDLFNNASTPPAPAVGCQNPGANTDVCVSGSSSGLLPNQITKINIVHMAMNSTLKGTQFGQGKGYQGLDLETSVSARDLTYNNLYPLGP